jgi:ketosteroid isomerase-like protein
MTAWRNIETLRRCLARFQARDEERFLELMDPDVDLVPAIAVIEPDELAYAHEGVHRWFADIAELSDYRVEFDQFHRVGDDEEAVLVTGRVYFLEDGEEEGRVYDIYYLFGFREGKVASLQTFRDEAEARAAAGPGST